jgi:hypothetical protein
LDNAIISGAFSEGWYHRLNFRGNNTPNSKKNEIKPWLKEQWSIPEVNPEYVFTMEDVLDLYNEPYDPKKPKLYLDESPYQLVEEVRLPLAPEPHQPEGYDCEYKRNGVVNLFGFFEPIAGWRHIEVTQGRTKADFAKQLKDLLDVYYPRLI